MVQEDALRSLKGLKGVVELAGVGRTIPDGRKWLIMQPVGAYIALDAPAAFKIGAVKQLATIISSLASKSVIHGDISHFNVLCNPSDFGSAAAAPNVFIKTSTLARHA